MLASVGGQTIPMEKSKKIVSRKFEVDECNFNQSVCFNKYNKGAKTISFGSFGTPGQIRTADLSLRRTNNSLSYDSLTLHSASFCVNLAQ